MLSEKLQIFRDLTAYKTIETNDISLDKNFIKIKSLLNNNNDLTGFMMDVVGLLTGSDGLKEVLQSLLTKTLDKVEQGAKKSIKKHLSKNKNIKKNTDDIPNLTTVGIDIPIKQIDRFNKYKTKVISETPAPPPLPTRENIKNYREEYDKTKTKFDAEIETALETETEISVFNNNLKVKKVKKDGKIFLNIKAKSGVGLSTLLSVLVDLIFVGLAFLVEKILDKIFNKKTKNKSLQDIEDESMLDLYLEKMFEGFNLENITLLHIDLQKLRKEAEQKKAGYIFLYKECHYSKHVLNDNNVSDILNDIENGNLDFLGDKISFLYNTVTTNGSGLTSSEIAGSASKDSFFKKFIKELKLEVIKTFTSKPDILLVMNLFRAIENNGFYKEIKSYKDDLSSFSDIYKCLVDLVKEEIENLIFEYLKKEITKTMKIVIGKITEEQVLMNGRIYKSLLT